MNFILIAQPQTEMHLLAEIIESHPEITLPILEHNKRLDNLFAIKNLQGKITKSYLIQTSLNTYFSKKTSHNLSGVLTDCNSALSNNLPKILKRINKDIRCILLKRKNTLQQYVCLLKKEAKSVYCDEKEFFAFYKKLELLDIDTKIELNQLSIPYTEIYYEDLCNDLYKELETLKDYLGLKQTFDTPTKCFMLDERPLKQIINNFTRFYETFKDTRFNIFFE